jgi:TPR repeat protein
MMGNLLLEGLGTEVDMVKAFDHFHVAAKAGNTNSQYSLAMCYMFGEGVEVDMGSSLFWLREAAALGCQPAIDFIKLNVSESSE